MCIRVIELITSWSQSENMSNNALISMAPEDHDQCWQHNPSQRSNSTLADQLQKKSTETETTGHFRGGLSLIPPFKKWKPDECERPYLCPNPHCGKRYKDKAGLSTHRRQGWVCCFSVQCNDDSCSFALIGFYRLSCGEIQKEKRFVCPLQYCQKRYSTEAGLVEHLSVRQVILIIRLVVLLLVFDDYIVWTKQLTHY